MRLIQPFGASASPGRNEAEPSEVVPGPYAVDTAEFLRTLACTIVFSLLLVSFNPFPAEMEAGQGLAINQFGYSILAVTVLLSLFCVVDRRVGVALLNPWWLLLILPVPLSLLPFGMPDASTRAMIFTFAVLVVAFGPLTLAPDIRGFRIALAVACLAVLVLSYAGIVLMPARAIHQAGEVEAEHAGFWRGIYAHKNIAGPVMAAIGFAGIYLFRCGWRGLGAAICVLGTFFLMKTGSKTSMGLVPLIAAVVIGGQIALHRAATALAVFLAVAFMMALTLGGVVFPVFGQLLQDILPGTTFTGRTDLWRFALDQAGQIPWTGYGYGLFWGTPLVEETGRPYWLDWDMRGAAHAHNAYLDVALQLGWPAFGIVLLVLFVLPLIDYTRCRPARENRRLADLFLMILGFALLNASLESFFFDRDKQAWILLWISVVGLRLTRKLEIGGPAPS